MRCVISCGVDYRARRNLGKRDRAWRRRHVDPATSTANKSHVSLAGSRTANVDALPLNANDVHASDGCRQWAQLRSALGDVEQSSTKQQNASLSQSRAPLACAARSAWLRRATWLSPARRSRPPGPTKVCSVCTRCTTFILAALDATASKVCGM